MCVTAICHKTVYKPLFWKRKICRSSDSGYTIHMIKPKFYEFWTTLEMHTSSLLIGIGPNWSSSSMTAALCCCWTCGDAGAVVRVPALFVERLRRCCCSCMFANWVLTDKTTITSINRFCLKQFEDREVQDHNIPHININKKRPLTRLDINKSCLLIHMLI